MPVTNREYTKQDTQRDTQPNKSTVRESGKISERNKNEQEQEEEIIEKKRN